jgi:hypothetical protein
LRISVYLKSQAVEGEATLHVSRKNAKRLVDLAWARPVGQNAIQLTTKLSWPELKDRLRPPDRSRKAQRLPVREWNQGLLLQYPLKDQRTVA